MTKKSNDKFKNQQSNPSFQSRKQKKIISKSKQTQTTKKLAKKHGKLT